MLRVVVLAGLVAGCRIGFEPVGDAATSRDDAALDGDGVPIDVPASGGGCDVAACVAAGGSCVNQRCEIAGGSGTRVTCPSGGGACTVTCSGFQGCSLGAVNCNGAEPCIVSCMGVQVCGMGVDCGTSTCEVTCDGSQACLNGVSVAPSGTCEAHCCGIQACGTQDGDCAFDAVCP